MGRFTLSLLTLCQAASAIWLQSSQIKFPSTQIAAIVENPFEEFNPTTLQPRKLRLASFNQQRAAYPVVKFPERDMKPVLPERDIASVLPTRERGEFDSLVHFPPKNAVDDPRGNNLPSIELMIPKRRRRTRTETRRTKIQLVNKESGCGGRSMGGGQRISCRKTKKNRIILRPRYTTFGWYFRHRIWSDLMNHLKNCSFSFLFSYYSIQSWDCKIWI